jgi:transcriptional regulator with XRE-family HTH domain
MNRLKELRISKKYTLDDIEAKTGIKRGTYSNYENNKTEPKLETWQKLADFYGVSVPYLQGYEQPTPHNRLKELRQERGLSQEDLAKCLGITRQSISYYENGDRNPSKEIWQQLAVYFSQPVSYLKGEIDTQKIYKIIKAIMLLSQPEIDLTLKAGKMDSDETKKTVLIACFISLIEEINYDPVRAIDEVNSKLHNSGVLDDDTCDRLRTSMDMIRTVTDMALEQYNKL